MDRYTPHSLCGHQFLSFSRGFGHTFRTLSASLFCSHSAVVLSPCILPDSILPSHISLAFASQSGSQQPVLAGEWPRTTPNSQTHQNVSLILHRGALGLRLPRRTHPAPSRSSPRLCATAPPRPRLRRTRALWRPFCTPMTASCCRPQPGVWP